jgi:hypothetical protein
MQLLLKPKPKACPFGLNYKLKNDMPDFDSRYIGGQIDSVLVLILKPLFLERLILERPFLEWPILESTNPSVERHSHDYDRSFYC